MKQGSQPERRSFNQDRFDILIKRQRNGNATFKELTELDEIVNRDPAIRESVLEEMQEMNTPGDTPHQEEIRQLETAQPQNLLDKIKAFFRSMVITNLKPSLN